MVANRSHLAAIACVIVLSCALVPATYAQAGGAGTGPGGVGSTDGASSLELWIKADAGVRTDTGCTTSAASGDSVACWEDQSGNNYDLLQATTGSQPSYQTGVINSRPVIRFNGTSQYLDKSYVADLNAGNFMLYLVTRVTSGSSTYRAPIMCRSDISGVRSGYNFYASGVNFWEFWVSNNFNWTSVSAGAIDANWRILAGALNGSMATSFANGGPVSQGNTSFLPNATAPFRVGAGGTGADMAAVAYHYPGDIAEVIYYSLPLNSAQRTLIDNYLGAKYAITIVNDKYTGNDVAYVLNVAGIGKESSGNNAEGHSAGMVLRNGAFLSDNGDYMLIGHAAPTNGFTTDDLPTSGGGWGGGDDQRWSRVWYLAKTDVSSNGGTVGIDFDFGEGGMTGNPSGSAGNYRLLKRSGTSGQFTDIAQATSISGDRVIFDNVDSALLGSYFTVATVDNDTSPLAVALAFFTAQPQGDSVQLDWETISEIDTLGFTIYRNVAPDGDLVPLAFLPAQSPGGTAGASYTYLDTTVTPGQAYDYWLEDIDLRGVTTLHGPLRVTLASPSAVRGVDLAAPSTGLATGISWPGVALAVLLSGFVASRRRRRE